MNLYEACKAAKNDEPAEKRPAVSADDIARANLADVPVSIMCGWFSFEEVKVVDGKEASSQERAADREKKIKDAAKH